MKHLKSTIKGSVILAISGYILNTFLNAKSNVARVVDWVNSLEENTMVNFQDSLKKVAFDLEYDQMLVAVLQVIDSFDKDLSIPPLVIDGLLEQIVGSMRSRIEAQVNLQFSRFKSRRDEIHSGFFSLYFDKWFSDMDSQFEVLAQEISGPDKKELRDTYSNLRSKVQSAFQKSSVEIFMKNCDARIVKAKSFAQVAISGAMIPYERLVDMSQRIFSSLLLTQQVSNLVSGFVEESLAQVFKRVVNHDFVAKYALGDVNSVDIDTHFQKAETVRDSVDSEIAFRVEKDHVRALLENKASEIYLEHIRTVDEDEALSDSQKEGVQTYAESLYDKLLSSLGTISDNEIGIDNMRALASIHLEYILPRTKTYVYALCLEIKNILDRASLEGELACVAQFYEIRRVLDYEFFFALSEENGFDVPATEKKFETMFVKSSQSWRKSLPSAVRMTHIAFQYDDALQFLNLLSDLVFSRFPTLDSIVKEITGSIHEETADTIAVYLDKGIERVYKSEEKNALLFVNAVFTKFKGDIELSKVEHQINEIEELAFAELREKIEFLQETLPQFLYDFKSEVVAPFDEAWMLSTQERFITDADTDFVGMKKYAVEEMNKFASTKLNEYMELIDSFLDIHITNALQESLELLRSSMVSIVESAPIEEDRKSDMNNSLKASVTSVSGRISSSATNVRVNVDNLLRVAITDLDTIMDINTQNFFDTTLQAIVTEFNEWASEYFVNLYVAYLNRVNDLLLKVANEGKSIVEEYARKTIQTEVVARPQLDAIIRDETKSFSDMVVSDYSIVSYRARRGILMNTLKENIIVSGSRIRSDRASALRTINIDYQQARLDFRKMYQELATSEMNSFQKEFSDAVTVAYKRGADIAGIIGGSLQIIAGQMRKEFTDNYNSVILTSLYTEYNDLPEEINLVSLSYPPGILSIAESVPNDLYSTILPNLTLENSEFLMLTLQLDSMNDTSNVEAAADEALGSAQTYDKISYDDIVGAFADLVAWEKNKVESAIETMETDMDQALKDNTCSNKPQCKTAGLCEDTEKVCREGYVGPAFNSYDVPCCTFDPEVLGFSQADMYRMIGVEIGLMIGTTPSTYKFLGKVLMKSFKALAKGGKNVLALGSRVAGKRAASKLTKTGAKTAGKVAVKTGMKGGTKLAVRTMVKGATTAGVFGVKTALKLGAKKAAMSVMKSLIKVGTMGPIGAAMLVFDVVSMLLDVFDVGGYNKVQAAGQIRDMRDNILNQYTAALESEGIMAPMLFDPLYNVPPDEKGEFYQNLVEKWFADGIAMFLSANQHRWELMPDSEVAEEFNSEIDRMSTIMETDINFLEELVCHNSENTFMIRSSTVNGTPSKIVGTPEDDDYDSVSKTHLMQCSLTATGVVAANSFAVQKTDFMNTIVKEPIFRWVKLADEGGYKIHEDLTATELAVVEEHIATQKNLVEAGLAINQDAPIKRAGWSFVRMDPEEEFWRQYTYSKTIEFQEAYPDYVRLPRKAYIKAWKHFEKEEEKRYLDKIVTAAEEILGNLLPEGEAVASVDDVLNKTQESPSWYPEYSSLMQDAKQNVDDLITEFLTEQREMAIVSEGMTKKINEATDAMVASDTGVSVEEAAAERIRNESKALFEPYQPDFAVFKNGYGQISPLFTVKKNCDDMGYGVTFDQNKGLCKFTPEYCKRYGLTFFYNKEVGIEDCRLAGGQRVAETIFGTTVTRGVKSWFGANRALGMSLGKHIDLNSMRNLEVESYLPSDVVQSSLQKLGLSSTYSIW